MAEAIERISYDKKDSSPKVDPKWWTYGEKEAYQHAIANCRFIEFHQAFRTRRNVMHARMYANQFLMQFNNNIYISQRVVSTQELRVTLNVVKACVDTASSKIAKNKPRPLFLTEGGSQPQRERAKKLTQYVDGVFQNTKGYQQTQTCFRDAGIFGSGFPKILPNDDNTGINIERVLPDEVIVDDNEALYGQPRTMYQRRFMHRDVVLENWGDVIFEGFNDGKPIENLIQVATAGGSNSQPNLIDKSDMLYVVEGWHLPSGTDAGDGKHILCINNTPLVYEEYKKQYFPILTFYWTKPVIGFYGAGIIEEISGLQLEINKLLRDIQQAQHRMCAPQIWIENTTHVAKPITNELGSINRYTGRPPAFYAPSAMSSEVYNHVWNIYKRAFEIVGISELSATLKKPTGLESRAALREYSDIETERFALVSQDWEQLHLNIASIIVDLSRDMFGKNKELSVKVPGRKFMETIHWDEVSLEDDEFTMGLYPTSLLPTTPSGKLDRIQDLIDGGLLDVDEARTLLDFPDIESVMSLDTASREIISKILGNIVDKGEYVSPDQFMDLNMAVKMAQNAYLKGQIEDVAEKRLELLRKFIKQALQLSNAVTPVPPAQPASPLGATPGPAPQTPIQPPSQPPVGPPIPNTNGQPPIIQ